MNKLKRIAAIILMAMITVMAKAQELDPNADNNSIMKSNGKIYVVMLVVIVIVLGLFLYLINLDRKISKLEKE
jgi:CcmD family protein